MLDVNHELNLVRHVSIDDILLVHVDIFPACILHEPLRHLTTVDDDQHAGACLDAVQVLLPEFDLLLNIRWHVLLPTIEDRGTLPRAGPLGIAEAELL